MTDDFGNNQRADIAAACPGIWVYDFRTRKRSVKPVPPEWADFFVPTPWQEEVLPCGAYTSLWPAPAGNDWVKVQPEGWGPDWRPARG